MAHSPQADDITSLVNDVPDLTEEEKSTLILAMIKAKELDEQEQKKMSKPLEGQLYKYTNVVKGWQYRWFVLIPDLGMLEYYMLDEVNKKRPKGAVFLAGAVVSPSDEDGQSFTISAACGAMYKLKANDAKERQFWVNRIRAVAEHHTKTIAEKNPPLPPREFRSPISSFDFRNQKVFFENIDGHNTTWYSIPNSSLSNHQEKSSRSWKISAEQDAVQNSVTQSASSVTEALNSVKDMLSQVEKCNNALVRKIEMLPSSGTGPKCCDIDLLMLKATSLATIHSLQQCYTILQYQQVLANFPKATIEMKKLETTKFSGNGIEEGEFSDKSSFTADPSGEISDEEDIFPSELAMTLEQHELIRNIAHKVKLGADLTKVALPSFVLDSRSLLEMYADFMRHPDFFVRIPDRPTPETRMLAVLEWYLTCFHAAWEVSMVKKPYNPVVGETFHCSWKVNKHDVHDMHLSGQKEDAYYRVTYVGEQVSHHPPVSAFYAECAEKNMGISGHISVKSNMMQDSAVIYFTGQVVLRLLDYKESYAFTLPSAYLRGIIRVPWIELGDRVSVTCPESGYCAFVTFHTKPQNGVPHRITGEIKNEGGDAVCRVTGEWNGTLQFTFQDDIIRVIEVSQLPRYWKYIRPVAQQDAFESRKLWQQVTVYLKEENYTEADFYKTKLENEQREEEQQRHDSGKVYQGKLFQKIDDSWEYKYPLPAVETS